jgi:hypothetical protein
MAPRSPAQSTDAYRARQRAARSTPTGRATVGFRDARRRAQQKSIVFTLVRADVPDVPERCPACSTELRTGPREKSSGHVGARTAGHCSPTLDRVVSALGYVRHNVAWICNHCNALKNGHSTAELVLRAATHKRKDRYQLLVNYVNNHLAELVVLSDVLRHDGAVGTQEQI